MLNAFSKNLGAIVNTSVSTATMRPGLVQPRVTEPAYLNQDFKWHTNISNMNFETVYAWLNSLHVTKQSTRD